MLLESKALLSNSFFHTNLLSFFFLNSNRHKISFFNAKGFKLGHFDVFDMLFLKSRSRRSHDGLALKGVLQAIIYI